MSNNNLIGKIIPTIITGLVGIIIFLNYFFDVAFISDLSSELLSWAIIISAFAMGQGLFNLFRIHGKKIMKREDNEWVFSLVLLISMFVMILAGLPTITGTTSDYFNFIYNSFFYPMDVTVKALLGFFITSAAYRTFKIRNIESTLMLISAICVMFLMVPLGEFMGPVPFFGQWLRDTINKGAFRALQIGILVGIASIGLRTITGRGGGISRLSEAVSEEES